MASFSLIYKHTHTHTQHQFQIIDTTHRDSRPDD